MSPWQALIENKVPDQSKPWAEPVKTNGRNLNLPLKRDEVEPRRVYIAPAPMMDAICVCGLRYGQHRVNDFACMNQKWKPGNGQPQWLTAVFKRTKA